MVLKFKSNIMCGNCLAAVKPILDKEKEISSWKVDLTHPDRILEVNGDKLNAQGIQTLLKDAGYKVEAK